MEEKQYLKKLEKNNKKKNKKEKNSFLKEY